MKMIFFLTLFIGLIAQAGSDSRSPDFDTFSVIEGIAGSVKYATEEDDLKNHLNPRSEPPIIASTDRDIERACTEIGAIRGLATSLTFATGGIGQTEIERKISTSIDELGTIALGLTGYCSKNFPTAENYLVPYGDKKALAKALMLVRDTAYGISISASQIQLKRNHSNYPESK